MTVTPADLHARGEEFAEFWREYHLCTLTTLRRDGTLVLLGGSPQPHPAPGAFTFIMGRRRLAGSLIGGIAETQEMLDFCASHGIGADVEVIPVQRIDEGYARMLKGDVKYRFVVDIASLDHAP